MSEGLGIAAEHHVHVVQLAVHLNKLRRHSEEVIGRRAFLFRAVLGVGHDKELVFQLPQIVVARITFGNDLAKFSDDFTEVFARGNHAPTPDGVEPHRNGAVGQQRRSIFGDHAVGVINTEGE